MWVLFVDYRLEDFTYTDNDVGRLMNTNMDKVNFTTYFGQVSFSKNGESRKDLVIEQYQGKEGRKCFI